MDRDAYLAGNIFLPDLNNELEINMTYIERLKSLNMFAMIQFDQGTILEPAFTLRHYGNSQEFCLVWIR